MGPLVAGCVHTRPARLCRRVGGPNGGHRMSARFLMFAVLIIAATLLERPLDTYA